MKKLFVLVWIGFFFTLLLAGCDSLFGIFGEEDEIPETVPEPEIWTDDEFLALFHLDEHPVRDAEEVTVMVEGFLRTVPTRNSDTPPVITGNAELYNITVNSGFAVKPEGGEGAGTIPASSTLPFYRYSVTNLAANTTGVVIASGDKRIGGIIAYIEEESNDPVVTPFMDIFTANLNGYVWKTIDEYNSVTPEEIEAAAQKAGISASRNAVLKSSAALVPVAWINGTSFYPLTNNIKWNQGTGYNTVVNAVRSEAQQDTGYPVGCTAVAIAQVMAYHEWPAACSLLGSFNNSFFGGVSTNFSTVVYDWNAMKAVASAMAGSGMSVNGKLGVNVLLHEAAQKVGMQYVIKNSTKVGSASRDNIRAAFQNMGYNVSQSTLQPYDFYIIKDSIDKLQPVVIAANSHVVTTTTTWTTKEYHWIDLFHWFPTTTTHTYTLTEHKGGHAWVIDDYDFAVVEIPTEYGNVPHIDPMVHCNLGWGGTSNGWYKSGVFDTNEGIVDDVQRSVGGVQRSTVTTTEGNDDNYYRYILQIVPYLKPNRS